MTVAYTVRAGDTLGRIALKHDATISALLALNPAIKHPDLIQARQVLSVPDPSRQTFTSASATSVADPAPCAEEYVEIVHVTGSEELFFLTDEDLAVILEEEQLVGSGVEQLYKDLQNDNADRAEGDRLPTAAEGDSAGPIPAEKKDLVAELDELGIVGTSMQSIPNLTEIKRLKGNKHYTYVRSDKIANHWRSYKMTARDKSRSDGWLTHEGIDTKKLRKAVEADFGIAFKGSFWQLDPQSNFSQSMNQFYKEVSWSVWGSKQERRNQRDMTGFDASAEAQFMRFASGAMASGEFTPGKGKVHLQARADAQFSLAEGKATIEQAYPANNDAEIRIYYRVGGWNGPRAYETLGHFQARLTITASGYAGASAFLAANINVDCSDGTPKLKGASSDSADTQNVEAGAFAGVRAGCEVLGGLYWADKLTRQTDWKTLCQIGEKVEGAAGIGAEAYLRIRFNDRTRRFLVTAHAGLVMGLGASGTFVFQVDANNLASMVRFVYNGLLKVNIRYLEIFDDRSEAFRQYVQISLLALSKGLDYYDAAREFASSSLVSLDNFVTEFIRVQKSSWSRERDSKTLAENILKDIVRGEESVFLHSPPEVKGPVLNKLTYDWGMSPQFMDGTFTKVKAIGEILKSFQGWRDFEETMLRMNADGVVIAGEAEANAAKLFQFIGKHRQDYLMFKHCLKGQVAIADRPVQLDPFNACKNSGIA